MHHPGLTTVQVKKLLNQVGPNALQAKKKFSVPKLFLSQFTSPLIYILLIASVVTALLHEYIDSVVILLAVIVNASLGFFQEYKAQNALHALTQVLSPKARVMRDGEEQLITAQELVPGDIVLLEAGEQIPADGVLVTAHDVTINQAVLTGESLPVSKHAISGDHQHYSMPSSQDEDAKHFVYMGTTFSSGKAVMQVVETGIKTELGTISETLESTEEEDTPLQQKLSQFSRRVTVAVLVGSLFIFVFGIWYGRDLVEMFTLSVAVAVSAIPEGLIISLTTILAIGMQKILKRKALVRKLVAAETLGSVSVICTDKTGTLTKGELSVFLAHAESSAGGTKYLVQILSAVHSGSDPLEQAIRNWVENQDSSAKKEEIYDEVPFSSDRKYSVRLTSDHVIVVGAPEVLLKMVNTKGEKEILREIQVYTKQGYRVVGVASREAKKGEQSITPRNLGKLQWVGYIVFADEVRKGLSKIFDQAHQAGIRVKVITGDYAETALAVMKELHISVKPSEVILGSELKILPPIQLKKRIQEAKLFARTTPDQKLIIVQTLQELGEVVAMTGDGVNDAPALKRADIGIVVSTASDVSKEMADIVLLDNNFKTIMAAVEEGRGIFENLRKVLLYLLSDAFSEMIIVVGSVVLNLPLPITAAQILWMNLVEDGLPNLSLTVDPNGSELLKDKPRRRGEPLLNQEMYLLIGLISSVTGAIVLGGFYFVYHATSDLVEARSLAFAMLAFSSLCYVFSSRSLRNPLWKMKLWSNPYLIVAVGIGFFFLNLALSLPVLQRTFHTSALSVSEWFYVFATGGVVIIIIESVKFVWNRAEGK